MLSFAVYLLIGYLIVSLLSDDKGRVLEELPTHILFSGMVVWPVVATIMLRRIVRAQVAKLKAWQAAKALVVLLLFAVPLKAQLPTGGMLIPRDSIVNVDTLLVQQYDPPTTYTKWWKEIQQCTGLKTKLTVNDFAWIGVPGAGFLINGHTQPVPGWAAVENRTFLLLTRYIGNERLVKHEMTHALMWESGDSIPSHSQEFWIRCQILA